MIMKIQSNVWDKEYENNNDKWRKERISIPINLKNKRILEIGVGNGKNIPTILKQKPQSVTAIDISSNAIKICKDKFQNKNVEFVEADIKNSNLESNSFDVVLCYYVLNNMLKKDRIKAVKEMNRLLSNKGIIVFEDFSVGDVRQNSNYIKILEKNTLLRKNDLIEHFFTIKELKSLFYKFKIKSINKKEFQIIKGKPKLKRKIISAVFTKALTPRPNGRQFAAF